MEIRTATASDLQNLREIDGTIESTRYLHLEQSGEGLSMAWKLEERPLREKLLDPNRLDDETMFSAKQIACGIDEGVLLVAEHENALAAMIVAQPRFYSGTFHVIDVRVDYEFRRQGLAQAMLYQVIQEARSKELRAVSAETLTSNAPAAALLARCGFVLSGVDVRRRTNHDLVREAATLFWYAALD